MTASLRTSSFTWTYNRLLGQVVALKRLSKRSLRVGTFQIPHCGRVSGYTLE